MCHYCGCRAMPLIRDYIAEHDRVLDLADQALRAMDDGDVAAATRHLGDAHAVLMRHWAGEENGIFSVMSAREEEYAAYVDQLVVEHRELAEMLAHTNLADPGDQQRFKEAVAELGQHISKEEDGLFPASLTALDGADWDQSIAAWQGAHPGESMIPD